MKSVWFSLLKIVITFLWVVAIYWATTALTDPEKAAEFSQKLLPIAQSPYFIPGFFAFLIAIILVFWLPITLRDRKQNSLKRRLQQEGVPTSAEIIRVSDTGITVNKNPKVRITVAILDQEATFETVVSRLNIPQVGDWMAVLYDSHNPALAVPADN